MGLTWPLAAILMAATVSAEGQEPSKSTECPEYDRVEYSAPRTDWPGTINVEHSSPVSSFLVTDAQIRPSPHGTASYSIQEPDTTKSGPWTTDIRVLGNKVRPVRLTIRVTDHVSGGVRAHWLNERLLWLQVWRGRVVSTDMILDVDDGRFIWQQDANYNSLIVPCAVKAKGVKERTP